MGAIGGVLRATSGAPQFSTVSSVKNTDLQGGIDSLLGGYKTAAGGQDKALGDYITKYMSGEGAAASRTGQEIGSIDQFYNGGMASRLAQLRTQRSQAMLGAADLAGKQAIAAQNRSRVSGTGGMGSYNTRMLLGALQPIKVQAALDNANQERADTGYITGNQLSLAGQRTGMANAQAAYGLTPYATQMDTLKGRAGVLGGIGNLDQQNKFYGLQQKPNMWADVADSLDQGILNAAAIYSSVGSPGMGGGGGMGKKDGGLIGYLDGGKVEGPGTGTSDSIPTRLSKGEYVVPADVVEIPGVLPLLEKMRHLHQMHKVGKHQESLKARLKAAKDAAKPRKMADGGLAGSAQQLGERAMKDLTPQWGSAVMIGGDAPMGSGLVGAGGAGAPRRPGLNPAMPPDANFGRNDYFQPTNYASLDPKWAAYGNAWSNYYNNPSSPGYVKPGTFE